MRNNNLVYEAKNQNLTSVFHWVAFRVYAGGGDRVADHKPIHDPQDRMLINDVKAKTLVEHHVIELVCFQVSR